MTACMHCGGDLFRYKVCSNPRCWSYMDPVDVGWATWTVQKGNRNIGSYRSREEAEMMADAMFGGEWGNVARVVVIDRPSYPRAF